MVENQESMTAKLCAFVRAWHSNTSREKLFDDYLAYDLMGKTEYDEIRTFILRNYANGWKAAAEAFVNTYFAPIPLSRIAFTEERLAAFAAEYGEVQYVICGAGADTFSFRNENEHITVFEIDHPDTQRYKLERVRCLEWTTPRNVNFVSVDFEREKMTEKLLAAGFNPALPTFFSILGVSYYLTLPVFTETLAQIAALSAPESVLVFDYPQKGGDHPPRVGELAQITAALGETMSGGFAYNEVSRALFSLGFQIDTFLTPQKLQAKYFDSRHDGMRAFENVFLLSATYTGGRDYE